MHLCGQFCGWGISRNTGEQSQIEFHSQKLTCKAKKEPWKRNTSTNHNFFGSTCWFSELLKGTHFEPAKTKSFVVVLLPPSQQIQATIWASNVIITQMCFVGDTVLIPFTFDYYVLKSCKWSIQFEQRSKQTMEWHSTGHTDWFLHRDPYNG